MHRAHHARIEGADNVLHEQRLTGSDEDIQQGLFQGTGLSGLIAG